MTTVAGTDAEAGPERLVLLSAECGVFCHYLLGRDAPADVVTSYLRAHEVGAAEGIARPKPIDWALLRLARQGPTGARLADAYASVFARSGLLRRKLILLLAILESRGSTERILDVAVPGSRLGLLGQLVVRTIAGAGRLALAAFVITPLYAWFMIAARTGETNEPAGRSH